MIKQLTLFSTSHCHLCETALSLLKPIMGEFALELIDIAEDEALLAQYGLRIPVLLRSDTKAELNWPFTEIDIYSFLQ